MQCHRHTTQTQEGKQVMKGERLGLENGLHHGHVNERELDKERDRDSGEEHGVVEESAPDAAVLQSGREVEEYEACERLE
jgi:hypothetical protein